MTASISSSKLLAWPPPRFIADVSPKVRDVMQAQVLSVTADATAAEALGLMDEHDIRVMPVLDDAERRCRGLLSLFKLSKISFFRRRTGWLIRRRVACRR